MTDAQAEEMLALLRQIARQTAPPAQAVLSDLQALARQDRAAAIAEARRRSAEFGRQRNMRKAGA